jgi:hypothetical protein
MTVLLYCVLLIAPSVLLDRACRLILLSKLSIDFDPFTGARLPQWGGLIKIFFNLCSAASSFHAPRCQPFLLYWSGDPESFDRCLDRARRLIAAGFDAADDLRWRASDPGNIWSSL